VEVTGGGSSVMLMMVFPWVASQIAGTPKLLSSLSSI